jgi:thioredoxin-dependent peroxiredoxin
MPINDKAPAFHLPDQDGETRSLANFAGKTLVLYFFPKANTPGWNIEASEFRDAHKKFEKSGAVIVGVSPDKPAALKKFQKQFDLPFTFLSDPDKSFAKALGVVKEKNMYGKKVMGIERSTFVIGPDGRIQQEFRGVKAEGHANEVLCALK